VSNLLLTASSPRAIRAGRPGSRTGSPYAGTSPRRPAPARHRAQARGLGPPAIYEYGQPRISALSGQAAASGALLHRGNRGTGHRLASSAHGGARARTRRHDHGAVERARQHSHNVGCNRDQRRLQGRSRRRWCRGSRSPAAARNTAPSPPTGILHRLGTVAVILRTPAGHLRLGRNREHVRSGISRPRGLGPWSRPVSPRGRSLRACGPPEPAGRGIRRSAPGCAGRCCRLRQCRMPRRRSASGTADTSDPLPRAGVQHQASSAAAAGSQA
jgi:hypothetical protein